MRGSLVLLTVLAALCCVPQLSAALSSNTTSNSTNWNPEDEAYIRRSKCSPTCFLNGSCNEELGRCDCIKGKKGRDCSETYSDADMETMCREQFYPRVIECLRYEQPCLNACNKQGKCHYGVCKCKPGFYGADCALSLDDDGDPVLLAGTSYQPRAKRPLVYVYELPPEYITWYNTRRMDRSIHILIWQRLLSSGARTANPEEADWFFIPMRLRSHRDSAMFVKGLEYINTTWPYLQRYRGHRHFIVHTGDLGIQEMATSARLKVPNATWLTHWGLHEDNDLSSWRAAHRPGKDVVIPVYISPHHFPKFGMERSPLHPKFVEPLQRNTTFFFAGRICGDRNDPLTNGSWPNCSEKSGGYSGGVRQRVHYHHYNRSGFVVVTRVKSYDQHLMRTKFCLAPTGGGHGQRQILVSFMGCLPVTIGDDIFQPFEPELDWAQFSVQPLESQIPHLHELLSGIPDEQIDNMQRSLHCAAQHFVWSSITGGFMGETGQFDAFETTLELLRVKQQWPDASPYEYADLDPDFKRFLACGSDYMGGPTNATWMAAQGPQFLAAATKLNPLCSHSRLDAHEPPCYRCMRGRSNTHGVPGGFMCCGADTLASCPRVWD